MQILITGANGQLGSAIRTLSSLFSDHDFIFTDVEELDITNPDQLDEFFSNNKPEVCINCAGYTAVDKAEEEKKLAYLLNRDAVQNLRQCIEKYNCRLIHISTDYVFNGQTWTPYLELDCTSANSIYGQSKMAGEQVLEDCENCMIVRTSWLYSEYGNNFFKTMIKLMQSRNELKVVSDQVGTPTYAGDLAEALLNIVSQINEGKFIAGIFHYSNEGVASWYDFAWEIANLSKSECVIHPVETHEYPLAAPRPAYSVLNKNRIKQVYNLVIPYWKESLKECYKNTKIYRNDR